MKEKRRPKILVTEKFIGSLDSIRIKINYVTEVYEDEVLLLKVPEDFKLLTLYINKPKRMPRNKKVIIKGNYAYLYEVRGKIPKSGYLLSGLKRIE